MKLPSWLTWTKTNVKPDPSTHFEITGQNLHELLLEADDVRLRLVYAQDSEVIEVDGNWPLILDTDIVQDLEGRDVVTLDVASGEQWTYLHYYLDPGEYVTVAPADPSAKDA